MYDELTAEREKSISINMPGLMKDVYAWMAIALVVTGFSAWFVADNALLRGLFMGSRTGTLVLIVATFALVWRLSSAMGKMSLKTAAVMFLVYSVLNGITLSAVFLTYTLSSIGGVFFMTAGTFGIMSVYGYVTKADLSKLGNMCLMGLFGIILATVVGFFFDSTLLQMLISYAGILIFTGLTLSSIGGVFFMTAGTFGIMSVYGYVTKADLSKLGNMCLMGLFGIILATVVGFFFDSTLLQMLISYAGILIFTGLTIYDTQSIKRLALTYHSRATDEGQKIAIMGALTLYLDFINIFIYLLRLFGDRK